MYSLKNISIVAIFMALMLVSLSALAQDKATSTPTSATTPITLKGKIIKSTLEGGCWYFETEKGVKYEPDFGDGIPKDISSGQQLTVTGFIQEAKSTICNMGSSLKITDYKILSAVPAKMPPAPKGLLDGKVFVGTMTLKVPVGAPQGDIKPMEETINFKGGMLLSAAFGSQGYKAGPYVAMKNKSGKITFSAKAQSGTTPGDVVEWKGMVAKDNLTNGTTLVGTAKILRKDSKQVTEYDINAVLSAPTEAPPSN